MLEINNEGSIDICEFAVKAIEGGTDVFMVNVLAGKQAALAAVRGLEAAFPLGGSELSNKA
jgi:predicted lysophospholipase L1 biosynthesis ABC-type transport system permease subunit